jgi:hypothetical protein
LEEPTGCTSTCPFSTLTATSDDSPIVSTPSLPLAESFPPETSTLTPAGMATGFLPTRDIAYLS